MMENINDVAKKLGYSDAENLERCVESYGEPLGEWWEVIKSLVEKSNDIHNVSGIFMVHSSGTPISYHESEDVARYRVKEWHDTEIEAAQKVTYDRLTIE